MIPPPPQPHPCVHSWRSAGFVAQHGGRWPIPPVYDCDIVLYCIHCAQIRRKPVKEEKG